MGKVHHIPVVMEVGHGSAFMAFDVGIVVGICIDFPGGFNGFSILCDLEMIVLPRDKVKGLVEQFVSFDV